MKPKSASRIGSVLFLAAVTLAIQPLAAQNVTWSATGLPPGLTVSSVNGTTGKISGTPTTAGIYEACVYPVVGGMAGDMRSMKFCILPAGASVPIFYGYDRRNAKGKGLWAMAGGGGRILVSASGYYSSGNNNSLLGGLFTTTNGISFASRPSPAGWTAVKAAAISGNRTVLIGENASGMAAAYSDTPTGAFTNLPLPLSDVEDEHSILFSDTTKFFCGGVENAWTGSGAQTNLRLWTAANTGTAWVQRLSVSLAAASIYPDFDFAQNAATRILSVYWDSLPQKLFVSTDSGVTWKAVTNPGIMWLTYGAGKFVGTGNAGVWTSTNGTTWTKLSSTYVGKILFSAKLGIFFSQYGGTSKDALYWQLFPTGGSGNGWVDSGSGVIFNGSVQFSSIFVPEFWEDPNQYGAVNKAMNFTFSVAN